MAKKEKVLLAMSGGIDSSVAAILLLKNGYDVVGATYRVWDYISDGCMEKQSGCCSVENIFEAKSMAERLGIEHHIVDYRKLFQETIITNFIREYSRARTPNPCVLCNSIIKWGELLRFAVSLGCRYIATGHYARTEQIDGKWHLLKGLDKDKDQSYFLWMLSQEQLSKTLFPLGELTKMEVREIARQNGFEKLSQKTESQEICFIPDNNYRKFLKENIDGFSDRFPSGKIVSANGSVIGQHEGLPFYTIGQRKGIKVAAGRPLYVTALDMIHNTITLGDPSELLHSKALLDCVNITGADIQDFPIDAITKIRFRNKGSDSTILYENKRFTVNFKKPVAAITPGQSAVFYTGDLVIGGGIIKYAYDD